MFSQLWLTTLGQRHFVRWANVEPFLIANFQPTINQHLANICYMFAQCWFMVGSWLVLYWLMVG
jgi:hypothetical protein